jgi:putative ribosome biogenesis GTPase RsgA
MTRGVVVPAFDRKSVLVRPAIAEIVRLVIVKLAG